MFDTAAFLREQFGTPSGVLSFLDVYGVQAPEEAAVVQWFRRGAVPGKWLPILLAYKELDDGAPIPISVYFKG